MRQTWQTFESARKKSTGQSIDVRKLTVTANKNHGWWWCIDD